MLLDSTMNKAPPKHVYANRNKSVSSTEATSSKLIKVDRPRPNLIPLRNIDDDKACNELKKTSSKDELTYKKTFLAPLTKPARKHELELGVPHDHSYVERKKGLSVRASSKEENKTSQHEFQSRLVPLRKEKHEKWCASQSTHEFINNQPKWTPYIDSPERGDDIDEDNYVDQDTFLKRVRTTLAETFEEIVQDCPDFLHFIAKEKEETLEELRSYYRPELVAENTPAIGDYNSQQMIPSMTPCRNQLSAQLNSACFPRECSRNNSGRFSESTNGDDGNRFKTPVSTRADSIVMATSGSTRSHRFRTRSDRQEFLPRSSATVSQLDASPIKGQRRRELTPPLYRDEPVGSLPSFIRPSGSFLSSLHSVPDYSETETSLTAYQDADVPPRQPRSPSHHRY